MNKCTDWDRNRIAIDNKINLKVCLETGKLKEIYEYFIFTIVEAAQVATTPTSPMVPKVKFYPREVSELEKKWRKVRH